MPAPAGIQSLWAPAYAEVTNVALCKSSLARGTWNVVADGGANEVIHAQGGVAARSCRPAGCALFTLFGHAGRLPSKSQFDITAGSAYLGLMVASKRPLRKASTSSRTRSPARARKATTLRLDPSLLSGLELLQHVMKKPLNRLINEAVRSYVARRSAEVEGGLQDILDRVRAYRRTDPDFDKLWDEFVDAEARFGAEDPVEGSTQKSAGPAQTLVRDLLRT